MLLRRSRLVAHIKTKIESVWVYSELNANGTPGLRGMRDGSDGCSGEGYEQRGRNKEHTRIQSIRHSIKHIRIHIRMNRPITRRTIVPRRNEDRVSLSDGDGEHICWIFVCVDLCVRWRIESAFSTLRINAPTKPPKNHPQRKEGTVSSEGLKQRTPSASTTLISCPSIQK